MEYLVCARKETIELAAYLYAVIFFIMGTLMGIVIMKIRAARRLRNKSTQKSK